MITDKKITGLLFLVLLLSGIEGNAQINGIFQKAKDKSTKAIEKRLTTISIQKKGKPQINQGTAAAL
ncbi:hypothetical protein [Chryseobacterium wanjuense]